MINFGFNKKNNYYIKEGYKSRSVPRYFDDVIQQDLIHQPEVYELAQYFAERTGAKTIIDIGAGSGKKLIRFNDTNEIIAIDFGGNLDVLKSNVPNAKIVNFDFEKGLPEIEEEILKDSIIICADVIEHLIEPNLFFKSLQRYSELSKFTLISTPDRVRARGIGDMGMPANESHVREWTAEELHLLLSNYHFSDFFIGYTINANLTQDKSTILAISGSLTQHSKEVIDQKVLSIVTLYNEVDIIEHTINHLLSQGLDVHVIDNWSNDGSYEKVLELSKNESRVTIERFPLDSSTEKYEWGKLLDRVVEYANSTDYDWIMHNDADEIRVSPWNNLTLSQAISVVDSKGYNAIDFTILDFRPINNNYNGSKSPQEVFQYFEFGKRPGHFVQVKAWKKISSKKYNLSDFGGHDISFDNKRLFPLKFISKHYPIRSNEQAHNKIFKNRAPRITAEEKSKGWHIQYNNYKEGQSFLYDRNHLLKYNNNIFPSEFLVERLSGIGILRDN